METTNTPESEFYRTPPEVTQALLDREDFDGTILDPCAGMGDMTCVLRAKYPRSVDAIDLYDYGFKCKTGVGFLQTKKKYDNIILNPPFKQTAAFIRHALKLARKKVAVLCFSSFGTLQCTGRVLDNKEFPFKKQYVFTHPIRWLNNPKGGTKYKMAWFVFEKDYQGPVVRESITLPQSDGKTNRVAKAAGPELGPIRPSSNGMTNTEAANCQPISQLWVPYAGSKSGLSKEYLRYYPPHDIWVSVFGGSGAEIGCKPPSKIEVYNDVDQSLLSVFQVMQDEEQYRKLIHRLEHTPNGRRQYELCRQIVRNPGNDAVENAWAFIVASILGFSGAHPAVSKCWTGLPTKNKTHRLRNAPQVLDEWKKRFENVRLENDDWRKIIDRYDGPGVFVFLDPTYYPDTCSSKLYRHNLTKADDEELVERVQNLKAYCMICGYDNPLYQEHLAHWQRVEFKTRSHVSSKKPERTEVIWMNYGLEEGTGRVEFPLPSKRRKVSTRKTENAAKSAAGEGKVPTIRIPKPDGQGSHLSDIDNELLESIERRRRTIATMVRSVIDGDTTAFFLYGPGGHGKSKLIRDALQGHRKVKIWNSDMSARALVECLNEFPGYIHFFEDLEKVYKDADCQSILISACGGKKGQKRMVQWNKHRVNINFEFTGGIIITSNNRLDPKPGRLGAIASRFSPQEWKLTDPELAAMMRHIASTEYRDYGLTADEGREVTEFVITEMEQRTGQGKVDLRTLCEQAIPDYKQCRDGRSEVHWHDLVRARINGAPVTENRKSRTERLQYLACEVQFAAKSPNARLKLWKDRTQGEGPDGEGLGKSAFYDRLKEAKESGLFEQMQKQHRAA